MANLDKIKQALKAEQLGGWLFSSFRHRDDISDRILEIPRKRTNTRPWYCIIYPDSPPVKILHTIEPHILDHLEGEKLIYSSREGLKNILGNLKPCILAAQYSVDVPVLSFLDHGTALLFKEAGFTLTESISLIQRTLGTLSEEEIATHERTAGHLYDIVPIVWERVVKSLRDKKRLTEGDIQTWIINLIGERNLLYDHPPIVAIGNHSTDPHYRPEGEGFTIEQGKVLQLDFWAKEKENNSIFADISWVGVCRKAAEPEEQRMFYAVRDARDRAVSYIAEKLTAGDPPSGRAVALVTREFLGNSGYGDFLRHRTGHAIDKEIHGFGTNLDSIEFPDSRHLLQGSCFSIEPGVYGKEFGMRTEINGYIAGKEIKISGKTPQKELLTF